MTLPSIETLYAVCDATWPAASESEAAGFLIRDGQGGGKRVSAATLAGPLEAADIEAAENAMRSLGQTPLFQVRASEDALDAALQEAGYTVIDPVNVYVATAQSLATELPPRTVAIPAWEPLHIMKEIWDAGGIGPERINVMLRANGPKTGFVSRWQDKPAGTSYAAIHQGISMMHAIEIKPEMRRNGLARWAMRRLAFWTMEMGGDTVSVICTQSNDAANALYQSLGMTMVGHYHYRIKG